ncbi:MAG: SMI1/KNR4 family protein [Azonexus sp.]|jgi:hypothetical protein|nr:SMI1/KNR4 family protein [Azonexus sp.]
MKTLLQQFDATYFWSWTGEGNPSATDASIHHINQHFGITLPSDLVYFAKHSKNFRFMYLGFGPDYPSESHIIRVNSYWRRRRRTRRVPRNLILITPGYDDYFWGLDMASPNGAGSYAVQFWCPDEVTWFGEPILRYPSFAEYIAGVIQWEARVPRQAASKPPAVDATTAAPVAEILPDKRRKERRQQQPRLRSRTRIR